MRLETTHICENCNGYGFGGTKWFSWTNFFAQFGFLVFLLFTCCLIFN